MRFSASARRLFLFLAALLLITGAASAADATPAASTAERIARVESGLRPPSPIAGDPGWTLEERMAHYGVPGVGIAVIDGGKVVWFDVRGLADRETGEPVTRKTLFQAGSVSKPVSAFAAMRLVEQKKLALNEPVNDRLKSWKIPDNEFTKQQPVTLSELMSHTAGTTVHGFPGYAVGAPVPTLVQVLNGEEPANTPPIRVDKVPGSGWRYSGGGYTIMQQLMIDVTGEPYPELMHRLVLGPVGMSSSTFQNPLPADLLQYAAAGVLPDGRAVTGKRHTYPEMAAAGLWTTAEDLARFVVEVQKALAGKSKLLDREVAERMVEPVVPYFGRGFSLDTRGGELYFGHNGWDEGFCALLLASRDGGHGVVVMINSNHPDILNEIVQAVALEYDWPGYQEFKPLPVSEETIATFSGRYKYNEELSMRVFGKDKRLYVQFVGSEPEELVRVGDNRYVRRQRTTPIQLDLEDGKPVFSYILEEGKLETHRRLADDEKLPRELLAEGDLNGALAGYRKLKEAKDEGGSERYLNSTGLDLARGSDPGLGIDMLLVNTALYPESANTWDSVGLAYRTVGYNDLALLYYRKALEVDPNFPSAVEAVRELSADE